MPHQGGACNFGQCPDGSSPGICGCGRTSQDSIDFDGDGVPDCIDLCPGFDNHLLPHLHSFRPPACPIVASVPSLSGLAVLALFLLAGTTCAVLVRRQLAA